MDQQKIGMCGAYCGVCNWKKKNECPGCQSARGHLFWGTCAIAACARSRHLFHCGLCPDLPCEKLKALFDHPEHGDHGERLINLQNWAEGKKTFLALCSLEEEEDPSSDPMDEGE